MWYTLTMEYYSTLKREEILSHVTTWMNFEDIMLSKPVIKRQILYDITYMRYLNLSNSEKQSRMVVTRG